MSTLIAKTAVVRKTGTVAPGTPFTEADAKEVEWLVANAGAVVVPDQAPAAVVVPDQAPALQVGRARK